MLNLQEMYDYIDSQEEAMMKLWKNIVEIESWSSDLEGVKKLADHLDTYFDAMGMNTRKYIFENAGPSLAASNRPGRLAPIALMGHMDTARSRASAPAQTPVLPVIFLISFLLKPLSIVTGA